MSFVLVIVAAVTLVIGLLTSGLAWVFVSIACSAIAGIVLIAAVLRSRPRPATAAAGPAPLSSTAEARWGSGTATATETPAVSVFADEDDEDEEAAPAASASSGGDLDLEFPIDEYDDLKVGEIVPLLPELDVDELEMVRDREAGGRNRATILQRIEALLEEQGAGATTDSGGTWSAGDFDVAERASAGQSDDDDEFPIAEYDDLKVGEITPLLSQLEPDELEIVRVHEASGKNRAGILSRIDSLLGDSAPKATGTAKKATGTAKKASGTAKKATGTAKKATGTAKKATGTAKKATGGAKKTAAKKAAKKTTR